MNSRTRPRRPASIGSNQSSRRQTAVSASNCRVSDFVLLLVMAWAPPDARTPGSFGFQHPETTPTSIPTTLRTAPYTFTLRDSLRWHDGQPVLSEDCVESLKRWGKKDRFGQLLMAFTGKIAPVDKQTFTLESP